MNLLQTFRALGPVDYYNVRRDPLLKWMVFLPIVAALALRVLIPLVGGLLRQQAGIEIRPYDTLINSMLFSIMPMMVGMIIGFLLLDQRDDRTLTALQVTPLSLGGYLRYRLSLPLILALLASLLMVPLAGIGPVYFPAVLMAALASAPLGPLSALFYAAVAKNKVQGFAVMKASGVFFFPAVAAYFFAEPAQWLFGLAPTYWSAKTYWLAQSGSPWAWAALLISLLYPAGLIYLLQHSYRRTAGE